MQRSCEAHVTLEGYNALKGKERLLLADLYSWQSY